MFPYPNGIKSRTVFLGMSFGCNSETLLNPAAVRQYARVPRPSLEDFESLSNPVAARQYPTASRPGFGEFARVSELYPEDILRNTV